MSGRRVGGRRRQHEQRVAEAGQRDAVRRAKRREKLRSRALELADRRAHAAADVEREQQAAGGVLGQEGRDVLRDAVFEHLELRLLQPFHEPPVIVSHVHGDEDRFDRDRMREVVALGAHGLDQGLAAGKRRTDAYRSSRGATAGIIGTLERARRDFADLFSLDEERDVDDVDRRGRDVRDQFRRPEQILVGGRPDDGEHWGLQRGRGWSRVASETEQGKYAGEDRLHRLSCAGLPRGAEKSPIETRWSSASSTLEDGTRSGHPESASQLYAPTCWT